MASWMIHLRVAQELLEKTNLECVTEFIMGNIAPDSGVPSEDGTNYIPSNTVSHYNQVDENGIKGVHEERFIASFLTEEQRKKYTKEQYTFYFGYLTHLLTDKLWAREIVYSAKAQMEDLFQNNNAEFWRFVKHDWYDLDFLYLRKNPDFKAFQIYENTTEFKNTYLEFFAEDAFEKRRGFITGFYHDGVEKVEEREMYISAEQLDAFVSDAVDEIIETCREYLHELLGTKEL